MATIIDVRKTQDYTARAIAKLGAGECVAMPTETVYGLAADATNGVAVAGIFEMKGRPRFNPLIAHVSDLDMAHAHGHFDDAANRLAQAFWPGPLTLVVPRAATSAVHDLVTAGLETVGLRMPLGIARGIIAEFGRPVAAPSANRSGKVSPTTAAHVAEDFSDTDLLILDDGPCAIGLESTIVRTGRDKLTLLRPGAVTAEDLTRATGLPVVTADANAGIEAPGMMASHYAPRAQVRLNVGECPPGAALIAFGPGEGRRREAAVRMLNLSPEGDLKEAAANLYSHMKALDAAAPDLICVEPVPTAGIGAAINDRLARAAAPRE